MLNDNLSFIQYEFTLNGNRFVGNFDQSQLDFGFFTLSLSRTEKGPGQCLECLLSPQTDCELQAFSISFPFRYQDQQRIFANGFQSWSESREFRPEEGIPDLRPIAKPFMGYYGDYHFRWIRRGKGFLHSWAYAYIRGEAKLFFIGSLGEKEGFTLIEHRLRENRLYIHRECEGLRVGTPHKMIHVWVGESEQESSLWDHWTSLMQLPALKAFPATGWTSWYHYYNRITESILLNNLKAFGEQQIPIDFFQIDDGFQQETGDWLDFKPTFPNGLAHIAAQAKAYGIRPGIWLAPFVASKRSRLVAEHPEYLLRDKKGRPVKAGYNPLWGGWYYALNVYEPGLRRYLADVFARLKNSGFELFKLDFLFAACLLPQIGKSRGQVMHEAMALLREWVGDSLILACGVPLGAAFGQVDYCRIGADIHLQWEHRLLHWLRHRERVSTRIALHSNLGRWALSGRVFWNDPDVFLLRRENIGLSPEEQHLVQLVNCLSGHLLFTSDDISAYSAEQMAAFQQVFKWKDLSLVSVRPLPDSRYELETGDGQRWLIDLRKKRAEVIFD